MASLGGGHVVWNHANYAAFTGWNGPIGRDLAGRLQRLEARAISSAGVRTGYLRSHIRWSRGGQARDARGRFASGLEGRVTASAWYATMHHEGTRPHLILPRRPGGKLVFRVAGRVVHASSVRHPGTRPNPYLTRWLSEAVR